MSGFYLDNSLLGLLSEILPTSEETHLLRACLWSGEPGAQAWQKWRREIATPAAFLRQEKDGVKGLLPLLFDSMQANGVSVEGEFRTYLRTAYLRDELRSRTYGRICREVMGSFASAAIPAVLLKGAALAETCYKSPGLQHAHYLEILIRDDDPSRAVEALRPHAFTCASIAGWEREEIELVHESGLPLVLHRRLFRLPFYSVNMEEIWARSRNETMYGAPTRILSSSDNLLHICGSVFDAERYNSFRWVCDAWFLIHRSADLDWSALLELARQTRMSLPMFITARYLAESLNAPIPSSFLAGLNESAISAQPVEREAALFAVQTNARGGLKKIILGCGDWPTRKFVLKWAILPSREYMRCVYRLPTSLLLPFSYLYRPLKYLLRFAWFCGRRVALRLRERFEPLLGASKAITS